MGWLLDRNKEEGRRLLIVLSDASPNDDQKIPSNSLLHGNRDYSGVLGVKDAAQEAAALRKKGVEVVCIYTGGERELPAARRSTAGRCAPARSVLPGPDGQPPHPGPPDRRRPLITNKAAHLGGLVLYMTG